MPSNIIYVPVIKRMRFGIAMQSFFFISIQDLFIILCCVTSHSHFMHCNTIKDGWVSKIVWDWDKWMSLGFCVTAVPTCCSSMWWTLQGLLWWCTRGDVWALSCSPPRTGGWCQLYCVWWIVRTDVTNPEWPQLLYCIVNMFATLINITK